MIDVIRYTQIVNHSLVTTTDATPTEIANITVDVNNSGLLVAYVHSMVSDGSAMNVGMYAVGYISSSSLSIGTKQTVFEVNGVAVAVTFADDGSGNISVLGTGVASTDITWICRTQLLDQNISVLS
jgi:hypothetical protein